MYPSHHSGLSVIAATMLLAACQPAADNTDSQTRNAQEQRTQGLYDSMAGRPVCDGLDQAPNGIEMIYADGQRAIIRAKGAYGSEIAYHAPDGTLVNTVTTVAGAYFQSSVNAAGIETTRIDRRPDPASTLPLEPNDLHRFDVSYTSPEATTQAVVEVDVFGKGFMLVANQECVFPLLWVSYSAVTPNRGTSKSYALNVPSLRANVANADEADFKAGGVAQIDMPEIVRPLR